jgi:ABC-2 type transport system permease protein
VFYSVSLLPGWAQKLSLANPILHMVNAFRYGFLGSSDVDITVAFLMMGLFAVILLGAAIWLMERGIGMRE